MIKIPKKDILRKHFEFAIDNISKFGDTDIFPFPIENTIFYDNKERILDLLLAIHGDFKGYLFDYPPQHNNSMVSSGYTGFRWATQLDPIWNAYFLGIVLSISNEIEKNRIEKEKNYIFSYRIKINTDSKTIFDEEYGWHKFQSESIQRARDSKYVLVCDISNFYSNIYHHRLENALQELKISDKSIEQNIMLFLQNFNNIKSYGLPIGGQASRILAELLLNSTDKYLKSKSIKFCRFVDDYHIFADTEEELYKHLLTLSEVLIENEGLSLQKSKTRILESSEFINSTTMMIDPNSFDKIKKHNLFSISYKYDPYSATAEEDYEKLKEEVGKLNILGILSDELSKSRVHTAIMKKLFTAIRYSEDDIRDKAISSLVKNIEILYPVFPNLSILIEKLYDSLSLEVQNQIMTKYKDLYKNKSYILKIDLNLMYALRIFAKLNDDDNQRILVEIYERSTNSILKRDIIFIMVNWQNTYFVKPLKLKYNSLSVVEKRAFLVASYFINEEGKHWRKHAKFTEFDQIYLEWTMSQKMKKKSNWSLPI